jgi:hypothetical protein
MAHQFRLEYPGALYDLTARGNEQQFIVHDDTDRQHFLRLVPAIPQSVKKNGTITRSFAPADHHCLLFWATQGQRIGSHSLSVSACFMSTLLHPWLVVRPFESLSTKNGGAVTRYTKGTFALCRSVLNPAVLTVLISLMSLNRQSVSDLPGECVSAVMNRMQPLSSLVQAEGLYRFFLMSMGRTFLYHFRHDGSMLPGLVTENSPGTGGS